MVSAIYILHWPESELEFQHSQLLLQRCYHNDLPRHAYVLSNFDKAYKRLKPEERTPFILNKGISYSYIRGDNDLMLLAVTRRNIDAMSTVTFLNNFYGILFHYLCKDKMARNKSKSTESIASGHFKLSKDVIVDNFNLVFELLDECMDFGIVQLTDYNILKEYIKVEANHPKISHRNSFDGSSEESSAGSDKEDNLDNRSKSKSNYGKNKTIKSTHNQAIKTDVLSQDTTYINSSILRTSSSAINWRPKGIFYAKNEIYIDIIEDCEFYFDLESEKIKRNEIYGTIAAKCYLSGMPTCKIGFNEKYMSGIDNDDDDDEIPVRIGNQLNVEDEDEDDYEKEEYKLLSKSKKNHRIPIRNIQFHQCIQLGSIYKDNTINFIPPDDEFILMTYHVEQLKQKRKLPLIMIKPTYRIIKSAKILQVLCVLNTNFKKRLSCRNLLVKIPINPHIFNVKDDSKNSLYNLKYKAELGTVSYKIDSSELFWNIESVPGKKSVKMMAELTLYSDKNLAISKIEGFLHNRIKEPIEDLTDEEIDAEKELDQYYAVNGASSSSVTQIKRKSKTMLIYNDIKLNFIVPMLSYSGLKLNYLRVDEEQMKYTCFPWVRYITESNSNNKTSIGNVDNKDINGENCNYRFRLGISCFQLVD